MRCWTGNGDLEDARERRENRRKLLSHRGSYMGLWCVDLDGLVVRVGLSRPGRSFFSSSILISSNLLLFWKIGANK